MMKLTQAQIDQFNAEGYLVVRNALDASDIDPVIEEYAAYIDKRAQELFAAGKISQLYADEPFNRRLALICRENNEIYPELDIMHLRGKASFAFLRNQNLLDIVEGLVGSEITCSPIQHIRAKLPEGLTPAGGDQHVAPWHQDAGVTWAEADPYFILTVWLPFAAATPENGCLQVIPRTYGQGLLLHHSKPSVGTTIVEEAMPTGEVVTLPMNKGDILLMHKEIPHRSTPNVTDTVRWSADLRYQKTGTPTGRPFWPDFVARSQAEPATVLTDWATWDHLWAEALESSKGVRGHRWQ
ncbi:MAG: phytanoyl-CoA dioxygenase family protein [Chloroflexi bacterium]|nr:phytanoyl-CoA dioxygenase family protein [Chloroflexota bacterium]